MQIALSTLVAAMCFGPPTETAPEGPALAPGSTVVTDEMRAREATNKSLVQLGGIIIGTSALPIFLGSIWYGTGVKNQQEGSDHEPGVPYGPVVLAVGLAYMSAGAVLLGVGVHRKKQDRVRVAPTMTWHGGGAQLGVVGRF